MQTWFLVQPDPNNPGAGRDIFLDNQDYNFSTISRLSGIAVRTLYHMRNDGRLWVYRERPSFSRGDWIKHALRGGAARPIPREFRGVLLTQPTVPVEKSAGVREM